MIWREQRSEGGYVLVTALIALGVMSILALAAISRAETLLRMSRQAVREEQALYMANAGLEFIYASVLEALVEEGTEYRHTMQLDDDVVGSYVVTAEVVRPGFLAITATGIVSEGGRESARKVLQAELPFERGGGDPPPEQELLLIGNGTLRFKNKADICGDIYVNGDLDLGNNVTVWARPAPGICDTIVGSGQVVVTGKLEQKKSEIQGDWCDGDHYGLDTPCKGQKPRVRSLPPPDYGALWDVANARYVQSTEDCAGKPNCHTFANPFRLHGDQSYQNELIYIDGDVEVNQTLRVTGGVTFVVTGNLELNADLLCTGGSTCNVAFIAGGHVAIANQTTVWATLFAGGTLETKNNVTIHGLISAGDMDFKNNVRLYPTSLWPVGLPGGPGSGAGNGGAYAGWNE